ncbi:hypothetical protein DMENIID0001_000500 [Sergentomyia squamirostris]
MLLIVGVFFFVFLINHLWTKRDQYRLSWKLNGPAMLPLIGTLEIAQGLSNEDAIELLKRSADYSSPIKVWLGPNMYIVLTKPEHVEIILSAPECFSRSSDYNFLKPALGDGLLSLDASKWKLHRKLINSTFNLKILKSFVPIFNKEFKMMISQISKIAGKYPIDLNEYIEPVTLDIVCQTTMGMQLNNQNNQDLAFVDAIKNALNIIMKRNLNVILWSDVLFRMSSYFKTAQRSSEVCYSFVNKILQKKKEEFKESLIDSSEHQGSRKPMVFIDLVMKLLMTDKQFTEKEVIGEINTIIATGFETTATTTINCILAMAMFPECQEMIYEEIKSLKWNKDDDVQYEDMSKFEYLDRFIKETLRFIPTIPFITRTTSASLQIEKYEIPKGVTILIILSTLLKDKESWGPIANQFDPNRFLPENITKVHRYAYIPFSTGPRNCIGIKYANIFLKTILIHLVGNFKFKTELRMSDLRYEASVSAKLINKPMVYVEKRID